MLLSCSFFSFGSVMCLTDSVFAFLQELVVWIFSVFFLHLPLVTNSALGDVDEEVGCKGTLGGCRTGTDSDLLVVLT